MPIGPVQLLVVSFPEPDFRGEVMEELRRLRDSDVIPLIDAPAVQKDLDGNLEAIQWSDLSVAESEEFGATVGALLGLGLAGEEGMEAGAIAGAEAGAPTVMSSTSQKCGTSPTPSNPAAPLPSP